MNRRQLFLSACALSLLGTDRAQPASRTFRVGVLVNGGPGLVIDSFRANFARLGYREGDGFAIEPRYRGQLNRLPVLAAELRNLAPRSS
jgi:hypothetical protein